MTPDRESLMAMKARLQKQTRTRGRMRSAHRGLDTQLESCVGQFAEVDEVQIISKPEEKNTTEFSAVKQEKARSCKGACQGHHRPRHC